MGKTLNEHLVSLDIMLPNDVEQDNVELKENEFLLKVYGRTGFMVKLNKNGTIPTAFKNWNRNQNTPIYKIEECFRSGWKFIRLRHGQSAAWVVLEHPYGFILEINSRAFETIAQKITMVNGRILTPMRFEPALKNASISIDEETDELFIYKFLHAVDDDESLLSDLKSMIIEKHPDRILSLLGE